MDKPFHIVTILFHFHDGKGMHCWARTSLVNSLSALTYWVNHSYTDKLKLMYNHGKALFSFHFGLIWVCFFCIGFAISIPWNDDCLLFSILPEAHSNLEASKTIEWLVPSEKSQDSIIAFSFPNLATRPVLWHFLHSYTYCIYHEVFLGLNDWVWRDWALSSGIGRWVEKNAWGYLLLVVELLGGSLHHC